MIRKAKAVWRGTGRDGQWGPLYRFGRARQDAIFFQNPLLEREGHKPREAHRRSACGLLHDGIGLSTAERGLHSF